MRIVLLARGTRGDVQPMLVLGAELKRRGHTVILAAPPNLVSFAVRAGLDAHPLGPDSQAFLQSAEGQALLAAGNLRMLMARFAHVGHVHLETTHRELLAVLEGANLIVAGILLAEHAAAIAEARRIPLILVQFAPLGRTRAYAAFPVTTRRLGGALNLATWALLHRLVWQVSAADINQVRRWLDLPLVDDLLSRRAAGQTLLQIQAFSAHVVPGIDDYGVNQPIVGFFRPCEADRHAFGESSMDAELDAWLSAGAAPVYFGFGSMPVRDPSAALQMIEHVTQRLGLRALVSTGWSDLGRTVQSNDRLRVAGMLDHDAVLPRCQLAVHHGGSGTTAASTLAGRPTLICSVFADQPFWGAQVTRLGTGTHIRFSALSAGRLERALCTLLQPTVAERARTLAHAMCEESNAVVRAADLIEDRAGSGQL